MFNKAITGIIIAAILGGCRAYVPATTQRVLPDLTAQTYIEKYKDLAISEMIRTGVPASITLAQGMIESDFGRSTLARTANNHFGIKCHNGWTGPSIRYDDDSRNECFRKYRNPEESFKDHSDFLKYGTRYKALFDIDIDNYKAWAYGLKRAGYATNPDYANMLIRKIEENNLYALDGVKNTTGSSFERPLANNQGGPYSSSGTQAKYPSGKTDAGYSTTGDMASPPAFNNSIAVHAVAQRVMETNRVQYIIVRPDDTVDNLEKEFQLLSWELKQYNDIDGELNIKPGQVLYLQPKRNKAEAGKYYHTCEAGETMYTISQKYAVKLKKLYDLNRMNPGVQVFPGQRLWLRMAKQE